MFVIFKHCTENQHVYHFAESELCVGSLITHYQSSPNNCRLKFVSLNTLIWHKLPHINSWIYYTQPEIGMMTCERKSKTAKIHIRGIGRLTLSPFYKVILKIPYYYPQTKPRRILNKILYHNITIINN